MSTNVSSDVWKHSRCTGTPLLILVSLADQANDEGWCWPSVDLIAERCRVSRRTVQRTLMLLEELGELQREERRGSSTRYRVRVTRDSNVTRANLSPVTSGVARGDSTWHEGGDIAVSPRIINESLEPLLAKKTREKKDQQEFPNHWQPNDTHLRLAHEHGLDLTSEASRFEDHHRSKGSKFKDWDAAFRLWLANAARWRKERPVDEDRATKARRLRVPEAWI